MAEAVVLRNLTKKYPKGPLALDKVSFSIQQGEIFGLLGPNGAGKTTLINCIASLATITHGSIAVLGYDVLKQYIEAKSIIGLSPQDLSFDLYFSIYEILVYQAGYYGIRKKEARERAEKMLKL